MPTETHTKPVLLVPDVLEPALIDEFEAGVDRRLTALPNEVVVDCRQLDFVTSSHVSILWRANQVCTEAGIPLRLEAPPSSLIRVLALLDLGQFFDLPESDPDTDRDDENWSLPDAATKSFSLQFPNRVEALEDAIKQFLSFLETLALPESIHCELRTIFYEAVYNIHFHADLDTVAVLSVDIQVAAAGMILTFRDPGTPFDPTSHQSVSSFILAAQGRQRRGLGLPMLRKMANRISYRRTADSFNELTVEKSWRPDSGK